MNKQKYMGAIYYTIDEKHPDMPLIQNYNKGKIFNFTDIYTFPADYDEDYCHYIIKSDLRLVAGGGHNSKHIHHVNFYIKKIRC